MAKVIVTAEIEDAAKWEAGFRTHADLFRSQTVSKPIDFGITGGTRATVCIEPDDLDTFLTALQSPATAEAMAFDGVKRETVKVYVLDKDLKIK